MASRTVLGQSSVPACTYKTPLDVQSRPRPMPSVAQHPVQTARWAPSACCDPHQPKTLPCTFLPHRHQVKRGSQQCLEATQGSCHVTGDHPPGYHWQTKELQEDTRSLHHIRSPPPSHHPIKQRFNAGTRTRPQIQFGIAVHFENGACLVSLASRRQRGGLGGLCGAGRASSRAEQCCAGAG